MTDQRPRWLHAKLSWTLVTGLLFLTACLLVLTHRTVGGIQLYHDIGVVLVALSLNSLRDAFREDFSQPRFRVQCTDAPPCQVSKDDGGGAALQFLRLIVTNIGRTGEDACEVRIEQIQQVYAAAQGHGEPFAEHDPRPLRWAGRGTSPIAISSGAFDLVDLGVRRADTLENLRMDFEDRGQVDLNLADQTVKGFRIHGTVYGKKAKPAPFSFELTWKCQGDLIPIEIIPLAIQRN